MKRLLFILLMLSGISLLATPKINKENCTITLDNGKTFPLYGRVQIVESAEDLRVEVVSSAADVQVEKVTSLPNKCGQWEMVTTVPDIRIRIVKSVPDVTVEFVNSLPRIR